MMDEEAEFPADRCPLCGSANGCGVAAGKSQCWCFSSEVPEDVQARIPEGARGVACVCERCARGKRSPAEVTRTIKRLTTR